MDLIRSSGNQPGSVHASHPVGGRCIGSSRPTKEAEPIFLKEVLKLVALGIIYSDRDNEWVSLVHMVPKKSGIQVVENEKNELVPTRLVTG